MSKRVLILGATGAMATYLIPDLLEKGYYIDGVTLDDTKSHNNMLNYIQADAMDIEFLKKQVSYGYDGIVDFMIYPSLELYKKYYKIFLDNTKHYIFLSTYRVYGSKFPITEETPRIYDEERPEDFVNEREYSIYKAQEEDFLKNSGYKNYTVIRPAITYSKRRFQLTTLEADVVIYRMIQGKTVVLPKEAMEHQATMTWAGDVAWMIAEILFNEKAMGERYTVSTAEHHTWGEIAEMYGKIGGLKYITTDAETFLKIVSGGSDWYVYAKQQLFYDRCYDRIIDNSKILKLCGKSQNELMPLEKGLEMLYKNATPKDIGCSEDINKRMDEYLKSIGIDK